MNHAQAVLARGKWRCPPYRARHRSCKPLCCYRPCRCLSHFNLRSEVLPRRRRKVQPVNELLSKISSYNIFNYLFPGAVFSVLAERFVLLQSPKDVVGQLLWYYFVGLVISRVGSVVVEPILKRWSFIVYSDYPSFLRASVADAKLETMVEVCNTYRTLATAFALLLLSMLGDWIANKIGVPGPWKERMVIAPLLVLFLFSFRKQSGYVSKRVNHHGG
jgi:hypothetical protein